MAMVALSSPVAWPGAARAADGPRPDAPVRGLAGPTAVPSFWNTERRLERPDAADLPRELRIVTADDYPPFNFLSAEGVLTGFNVDLARAICAELQVVCAVQAAAFDSLVETIEQGRADAAIAGIAATPVNRAVLDFSERYLGMPARFIALKGKEPADTLPETVASKRIAVVSRTAHEAYLRSFFNEAAIRPYPDLKSAQAALRSGEADLLFADGIALALWLNGTDSGDCCVFAGGAFTESRFFGEGFAVAVKGGNDKLRHAVDYALQRIWEKGVYTNLYLRWFPIGFY